MGVLQGVSSLCSVHHCAICCIIVGLTIRSFHYWVWHSLGEHGVHYNRYSQSLPSQKTTSNFRIARYLPTTITHHCYYHSSLVTATITHHCYYHSSLVTVTITHHWSLLLSLIIFHTITHHWSLLLSLITTRDSSIIIRYNFTTKWRQRAFETMIISYLVQHLEVQD